MQVNLSETWAETEDLFGQQRLEVRQTSNMVDKVTQRYLQGVQQNCSHLVICSFAGFYSCKLQKLGGF